MIILKILTFKLASIDFERQVFTSGFILRKTLFYAQKHICSKKNSMFYKNKCQQQKCYATMIKCNRFLTQNHTSN